MAISSSSSVKSIFLFLFLFVSFSTVIEAGFGTGVGGGGTRLGGKKEIKDVKNNKEIQELGKFCVEKYNLNPQNGIGTLSFLKVVKAESQVVSGMKYYLKISAVSSSSKGEVDDDPTVAKNGGVEKNFDAVVVVKAWVPSKELLTFAPSTTQ